MTTGAASSVSAGAGDPGAGGTAARLPAAEGQVTGRLDSGRLAAGGSAAGGPAAEGPDSGGSAAGGQVTGDPIGGPENPGPLLRIVRRQEIAFAMVGGVNTALGMVLTVMWLAILGNNVPPAIAVVLAYAISIVLAFVLHRTLVFRVRGHVVRDFVRFVAVNSGGLLMNIALLSLAVSVLHLPSKPAAVVVMGLVAIASYFGHRYISFHRAPAARASSAGSDAEQL